MGRSTDPRGGTSCERPAASRSLTALADDDSEAARSGGHRASCRFANSDEDDRIRPIQPGALEHPRVCGDERRVAVATHGEHVDHVTGNQGRGDGGGVDDDRNRHLAGCHNGEGFRKRRGLGSQREKCEGDSQRGRDGRYEPASSAKQVAHRREFHIGTLRSRRRSVERLSTGQDAAGVELLELEDELDGGVDDGEEEVPELDVESDFAGVAPVDSLDFFVPESRESVR